MKRPARRWTHATYGVVREELEMLDHAGAAFDHAAVLRGDVTPVYFGSASNNFGVQLLLDGFLALSPPPAPRKTAGSGNSARRAVLRFHL